MTDAMRQGTQGLGQNVGQDQIVGCVGLQPRMLQTGGPDRLHPDSHPVVDRIGPCRLDCESIDDRCM